MRIVDDGVGFDPAALEQAGRHGITGMRERAEEVGGAARRRVRAGQGDDGRRDAAMSARLRVLLAEPDAPTRAGIRMALEADGFAICAEPLDAAAAVAAAGREQPDVCLIDEALRGGAIIAVDAIFRRLPDCKLLILTDSDEPKSLFAAIRAGASGYLRKDLDPDAPAGDDPRRPRRVRPRCRAA